MLPLGKEARHHLVNVLRIREGAELIVFNGKEEKEALAVVRQADRKNAQVEIRQVDPTQRESPLKIELIQGIGKSDHMDFAIQKAVELGVASIRPIHTQRTQGRLQGERLSKKMAHWQSVIINACQQSGRCILPTLSEPESMEDMLSQDAFSRPAFILSPSANNTLAQALRDTPTSISLLIGPEGGFTNEEIKKAEAAQAMAVSLGPRILRMETAALAAIACAQQAVGDL